jgi:hypothetical protein
VRHAPLLECPRVAVMAESSRIGQNATLSVQRQVFFARAKQRIQKHVAVHRVLKRGLNAISAIGLFIAYMGCTTLSQSLETPSHCNQFTLNRILRSRHQNNQRKHCRKPSQFRDCRPRTATRAFAQAPSYVTLFSE